MPHRPLDRQHVSPLLRILVPAFPAATGILGISYSLTPRGRWIESPVFRVADNLLPLPVWGAAFLAVTLVLAVGMGRHRRTTYERALAVLVALLIIWSAVFAATAIWGDGSPTAWLWPAFAATTAVGTIRELTTPREGA